MRTHALGISSREWSQMGYEMEAWTIWKLGRSSDLQGLGFPDISGLFFGIPKVRIIVF